MTQASIIKKYEIYILSIGKHESSRIKQAVVIQTDLLNNTHVSTIICPIIEGVSETPLPTRIILKKSELNGLQKESQIMLDHIMTIPRHYLKEYVGQLSETQKEELVLKLNSLLIEDY